MAERTGNSRKILTAAGVGIAGLLIAEGGRRLGKLAFEQMDLINAFEIRLENLTAAAQHEGKLPSFAMEIDLGNRFLNHAVAIRLREGPRRPDRNISEFLEMYGVTHAVADRMKNHNGLWVRRMDNGVLDIGFRHDIVGQDNLFVYNPRPYHPNDSVLL